MISRNRSVPTAAAMSMECTTSANSTVDLLVLRSGVLPGDRCTAAVTESCTPARLGATRAARGRCGHPTLRRLRPPSFPIHQHRALGDSQKKFDQVAISGTSPPVKGTYRCCLPPRQARDAGVDARRNHRVLELAAPNVAL